MKACGEDSAQTKLKVHMGSLCKFIRVGEGFYQFTSFKVGNDFLFFLSFGISPGMMDNHYKRGSQIYLVLQETRMLQR